MRRKRLAVLASGQGTNLANIHSRIERGDLPNVELALVISNNSRSGAIQFGQERGIDCRHLSLMRSGGDLEAHTAEFLGELERARIDLVVLAGYMKMLPQAVVARYENRILNVHPSLLPAFGGSAMYGLRVHEAVIARGCKVSGATVHLVTEHYDEGPIVLQECCPVYDSDTPELLQDRVRSLEYELLPRAIGLMANEAVEVAGNRVLRKTE